VMQLSTSDDTHAVNRLQDVSGGDIARVVEAAVSDDDCALEMKRTNSLRKKKRESIK
jgi:hypothetical protein